MSVAAPSASPAAAAPPVAGPVAPPVARLSFHWKDSNQVGPKQEIGYVLFVFKVKMTSELSVSIPSGIKDDETRQLKILFSSQTGGILSRTEQAYSRAVLPIVAVKGLSFTVAYDTEKAGNTLTRNPMTGGWERDIRIQREMVDYSLIQPAELEPGANYRIEMSYRGNMKVHAVLVKEVETKPADVKADEKKEGGNPAAGPGAVGAAAAPAVADPRDVKELQTTLGTLLLPFVGLKQMTIGMSLLTVDTGGVEYNKEVDTGALGLIALKNEIEKLPPAKVKELADLIRKIKGQLGEKAAAEKAAIKACLDALTTNGLKSLMRNCLNPLFKGTPSESLKKLIEDTAVGFADSCFRHAS